MAWGGGLARARGTRQSTPPPLHPAPSSPLLPVFVRPGVSPRAEKGEREAHTHSKGTQTHTHARARTHTCTHRRTLKTTDTPDQRTPTHEKHSFSDEKGEKEGGTHTHNKGTQTHTHADTHKHTQTHADDHKHARPAHQQTRSSQTFYTQFLPHLLIMSPNQKLTKFKFPNSILLHPPKSTEKEEGG